MRYWEIGSNPPTRLSCLPCLKYFNFTVNTAWSRSFRRSSTWSVPECRPPNPKAVLSRAQRGGWRWCTTTTNTFVRRTCPSWPDPWSRPPKTQRGKGQWWHWPNREGSQAIRQMSCPSTSAHAQEVPFFRARTRLDLGIGRILSWLSPF